MSDITRLYPSAHKLCIERGRYKGEKPEDRSCEECNEVETEVHVLCQCNKYENFKRQIMYDDSNSANTLISYSDPYLAFFNL